MKVNFICPQCKATCGIAEIVVNVTQASIVEAITFEGGESVVPEYSKIEYNTDQCDGIDHFCCYSCGVVLESNGGYSKTLNIEAITTIEELMVWLQERGMLDES